jgi:hypothetical protein
MMTATTTKKQYILPKRFQLRNVAHSQAMVRFEEYDLNQQEP